MRTTVRLPDDLYDEVKSAALTGKQTVASFIEEALRAALLRRQGPEPGVVQYRVDVFHGTGVLPGVDLTASSSLLDVMDGR
jgi:Ribbon-helix-helix protein, copG family